MSAVTLASPDFIFASEDPQFRVEFAETAPDEDHRQLTTVWRLPKSLIGRGPVSKYHAHFLASQCFRATEADPAAQQAFDDIVLFAQPGSYDTFETAKADSPLLQYLGYGNIHVSHSEGGEVTIADIFTYPTTEALNRFMGRAFGDDGSLRFEVYEGAKFEAIEFVEALAERGTILVADEAPFSSHDLSDHAVGWIGIPPQAVKALRAGSKACLKHLREKEVARTAPRDISPKSHLAPIS